MIRFADAREFDKLIAMWRACFHDEEYAAFIFGRLQRPENILVLSGGDEPAAMLSFRALEMTAPETRREAAYIYGVATLPEHRGKGYSTLLLEHAHGLFKSRGYACSVLVPADGGLAGFYGKRGYETAFRVNKAVVEAEKIPSGDTLELEFLSELNSGAAAVRFGLSRGACFGDSRPFVRWDAEYLGYIIEEACFAGGDVFAFDANGGGGLAACYPAGDTVLVKELAMEDYGSLDAVLRSLREKFPQKTFLLYLREDVKTSYTNNLLPFGMAAWYDNSARAALTGGGAPPYLAHVLD